jgi:hypothetical protein
MSSVSVGAKCSLSTTVLLLALSSSACEGAGAEFSSGGSCAELSGCCSTDPLGAAEECRSVADANDDTECDYFLQDARAQGECLGGDPQTIPDAGPVMCLPDGWEGCNSGNPCCNGECAAANDGSGVFVCGPQAAPDPGPPPPCARAGEQCSTAPCCEGLACRALGTCG